MSTPSGSVSARLQAFCDCCATLAGGFTDALSRLERLQYHALIVTTPDGPLTRDSFVPAPGSAEQRLLDAIAVHRNVATAIDRYGQLILAIGRGDEAGQVETQRQRFEAASEALEAALPADAGLRAAGAHLEAEEKAATPGAPRGAIVTKLEAAGGHARIALGMVAKMASDSTPGKVAGLIGMITDGITHHERRTEGMKVLGVFLPDVQSDFAGLAKAVEASGAPLSEAADGLATQLLDWNNAHRPGPGDPARFAFYTEIAALLADARQVDALAGAAVKTAGQMPDAHAELGKLAGAVPTDGQRIAALIKSAEAIAAHRR